MSASSLARRRDKTSSVVGREVRDFLRAPSPRLRYPPPGGATFDGAGVARLRELEYQFVRVPFPRFPPANFELLVKEALQIPTVENLDDQRLFDAGLAAEYFLQVQASYAVPAVARFPALAPTRAFAPSSVQPDFFNSSSLRSQHVAAR